MVSAVERDLERDRLTYICLAVCGNGSVCNGALVSPGFFRPRICRVTMIHRGLVLPKLKIENRTNLNWSAASESSK